MLISELIILLDKHKSIHGDAIVIFDPQSEIEPRFDFCEIDETNPIEIGNAGHVFLHLQKSTL